MDDKIIETLSRLLDEKLKPVITGQACIEKKLDAVVENGRFNRI